MKEASGCFTFEAEETVLVLSTDAKPRLKWTPELHQQFVEAVNQLGGADKATPKSLMRVMGIPGLTLYHLKSHLQKFRLGKNQQQESCTDFTIEDYHKETPSRDDIFSDQVTSDVVDSKQIKGNVHLAEALQMQMEVQQKLHEQIEVQQRLQQRIEAQGRYLQKVLQKAQQTLAGYTSSPLQDENAKELSDLVLMVSWRCPDSSFSESTEVIGSTLLDLCQNQPEGLACAHESSLTSLDVSAREEKDPNHKNGIPGKMRQAPLMLPSWISGPSIHDNDRKRSGSSIHSGEWEERSAGKRLSTCREKVQPGIDEHGILDSFDLNSQCQNDMDLGRAMLDLNSKATEKINTLH